MEYISFNAIATKIIAMPIGLSGVTASNKIMLADRIAIGSSMDINKFATPPRVKDHNKQKEIFI